MNSLALVSSALALLGAGYRYLAAQWTAEWLEEARPRSGKIKDPPVTYLRPIKRAVPGLREKLEMHLGALQPDDQLILGLDAKDSGQIAWCDELATKDQRVHVVRCESGEVLNPKVSKLVQMAPLAQNDRWILCDSELLLDADFATALRAEWESSGADAITCGYRFVNLESPAQQLDAAASLLTLWPGLAVLRRIGRVRLALGACTAVHGSMVNLAAIGDRLAEDFHLGARLAKQGKKVVLSTQVAVLDSDLMTWRDYWRHQQRVAVTYRACNPIGFAPQILVHSMTWSLLAVLTGGCGGLLVALSAWAICIVAARISMRESGFSVPMLMVVIPVAGWVETACWVLSWGASEVWWGGRPWPVSWTGKLKR